MSDDVDDKITRASPVRRDAPRAWIQWKGTDLCADIVCTCGELTHLDGFFAYSVRCGECGCLYGLDPNITLVPLEERDVNTSGCEPLVSS